MSERSPTPEPRHFQDDELIDRALDLAEDMESPIDHPAARVIASQIDGGPRSAMHSFVTTGAVREDILHEAEANFEEADNDGPMKRRIGHLAVYLALRIARKETDAVPEWSRIWLEQPTESDYCACCEEHISGNHRVGCPLGVDDEQTLNRVLELQAEHGTGMMLWLNYLGFRNDDELREAVASFENHFYGAFPSIEAFRQEYEVSPNAYIDQQYLIEEREGLFFIFDR